MTTDSILIAGEIRMPAELVELLRDLQPKLAHAAEVITAASVAMEPVVVWLDALPEGSVDRGIYDTIEKLTAYGRVEELFRTIAAFSEAAFGERPSYADVPWYDAYWDRRRQVEAASGVAV